MNHLITSASLVGLLMGGSAIADDTPSRTTLTTHQAMKDCIEQQKTVAVTMSKSQMKRICKDKLKAQKAGEMPAQPATDAPHN